MKMKSKYLDILSYASEKKVDPARLHDAVLVHSILADVKIPADCLDDTIDTILDVYYRYADSELYTLEQIVDAYMINFEQFGCNPVANYNFMQDSDKFIAQSLHISDSDEIDAYDDIEEIEEIDLDDTREWED